MTRGLGKCNDVRATRQLNLALRGATSLGDVFLRLARLRRRQTYGVSDDANQHFLEVLAGVLRVAHVLERLGRVLAGLGDQDLLTTRVLLCETAHGARRTSGMNLVTS